jgi:hypothetical protein
VVDALGAERMQAAPWSAIRWLGQGACHSESLRISTTAVMPLHTSVLRGNVLPVLHVLQNAESVTV